MSATRLRLWAGLMLVLAVFILPVLAQNDPRVQHDLGNQGSGAEAAQQTKQRKTAEEIEEEARNAPISEKLTKIAKAYFIGKRTFIDYEQRELEDEDDGVTRLTDANYHEIVESPKEKDTVWVVIMHGDATHRLSPEYFDAHTEALKLAHASDSESLKNVKWARMDYVDEWKQCARWLVFRPPQLIIISDGGKSLRFFTSRQFPAKGQVIYDFIESEQWKTIPPWESSLRPGASNSWIPEAYIKPQAWIADTFGHVPSFLYMVVFGGAAKWITNFFHSMYGTAEPAPARPAPAAAGARAATAKSGNTTENVEKALKELRARREREAKEKEKGSKAE